MKLLFDQNLSPRLTLLLADIYAESVHVREVGLREADDLAIWLYAKAEGFAIVSKDSDFQQREPTPRRTPEIHLVEGWQLHYEED